jgi:hypothetical protein
MTREIRLNDMSWCIFASLLLIWMLAGCQTLVGHGAGIGSGIHTLVHKETVILFPTGFSLQHAIYVTGSGASEVTQPLLSGMLSAQGFNVVSSKEEADFVMRVTAFVTMPVKQEGHAMPYAAEYLLSMREELPVIEPLLQPDESPKKQMENMAKRVRQSSRGIMGVDTANAIGLGTTFGDGVGGLVAGRMAGIVDAVAGAASRNNVRAGLAGFCFTMHATKSVLNQVFGLNVYAASKHPEHPEALLRAAIERAAIEMGQKASW